MSDAHESLNWGAPVWRQHWRVWPRNFGFKVAKVHLMFLKVVRVVQVLLIQVFKICPLHTCGTSRHYGPEGCSWTRDFDNYHCAGGESFWDQDRHLCWRIVTFSGFFFVLAGFGVMIFQAFKRIEDKMFSMASLRDLLAFLQWCQAFSADRPREEQRERITAPIA